MAVEPVAVISDIHGNRWALESVLEDIDKRGVRNIVNLGDCLYGPLEPAWVARILIEMDFPTVRGNEDRIITEPRQGEESSSTLRFVLESLDSDALQWLEGMPTTQTAYEHFFLCHGSPQRDDEYLLETVSQTGVHRRAADELEDLLDCVQNNVICCGHDHVPRTVHIHDGRIIVNPGSVGLQAYVDDVPYRHAMQTGRPQACYSIIDSVDGSWKVDEITVPYDHESAARRALENGRLDWAHWLRTGLARDLSDESGTGHQ